MKISILVVHVVSVAPVVVSASAGYTVATFRCYLIKHVAVNAANAGL